MNKGFSLVELIVVIAIMAILVGVAVPVYTSYIGKANIAVDQQAVDNLKHACEIVEIEYDVEVQYTLKDGVIEATIVKPDDATPAQTDNITAATTQLTTILGDAGLKVTLKGEYDASGDKSAEKVLDITFTAANNTPAGGEPTP